MVVSLVAYFFLAHPVDKTASLGGAGDESSHPPRQGRIIHCAGCTMGGGPAARGPRSTANFLPRCVDVRWRLKRSSTFWEKKSVHPREKILGTRMKKGPSLTLRWGPRMVNPALFRGVTPEWIFFKIVAEFRKNTKQTRSEVGSCEETIGTKGHHFANGYD